MFFFLRVHGPNPKLHHQQSFTQSPTSDQSTSSFMQRKYMNILSTINLLCQKRSPILYHVHSPVAFLINTQVNPLLLIYLLRPLKLSTLVREWPHSYFKYCLSLFGNFRFLFVPPNRVIDLIIEIRNRDCKGDFFTSSWQVINHIWFFRICYAPYC